MTGKSEYLKKYLKSKGPQRSRNPPSSGSLKLGSDDEDLRTEGQQGTFQKSRSRKKALFQVLRRAPDGHKFLFKDSEAEELPDSDEEEVKVVGEDGQTLALSEADKKKVAELIAKEEGKELPSYAWKAGGFTRSPGDAERAVRHLRQSPGRDSEEPKQNERWKEAFAVTGPLLETARPPSTPSLHGDRRDESEENTAVSHPRRTHQDLSLQSMGSKKCTPSLRKRAQDTDSSPARGEQNADLSPPRRGPRDTGLSLLKKARSTDPSLSCNRREEDLSPPRKGRNEDLSPPRRPRDKDLSPPKTRGSVDLSPPRNRHEEDLSPPRKGRNEDLSPPRRPRERDLSPPRRPTLASRSPLPAESSSERYPGALDTSTRDNFATGGGEVASQSSQVVFRDAEGRIISEEEWLTLEGAKGRKRRKERGPAPVLEWGSGLKQKEDSKLKKREEEKLAKQPFARYEIDQEYDADLRSRDRWADPLGGTSSSKQPNRGAKTQQEEETQDAGNSKKPTCPHDAPLNRFNIKPGYRWDGVVRGNGYEEEYIKAINRRKWEAEMAHMNNTADM
ncbi:BUD13 homolog [Cyclospora cayetanensis]|uniref:BUD13 homolog n=1 Tax=Cyclospora cayetanensis TaxID=88456 RepID=A0A6P6RRJ3_9EIME|nr:BUD13 homolog [Cyclospora cayetanensis]